MNEEAYERKLGRMQWEAYKESLERLERKVGSRQFRNSQMKMDWKFLWG